MISGKREERLFASDNGAICGYLRKTDQKLSDYHDEWNVWERKERETDSTRIMIINGISQDEKMKRMHFLSHRQWIALWLIEGMIGALSHRPAFPWFSGWQYRAAFQAGSFLHSRTLSFFLHRSAVSLCLILLNFFYHCLSLFINRSLWEQSKV